MGQVFGVAFGKTVVSVFFGHKIKVGGVCRIGCRMERRLRRVADGSFRQPNNQVGVVWARAFEMLGQDRTFISWRKVINGRRVRL